MKRVIVKRKVIDVPYAPGIPAIHGAPEYWSKEGHDNVLAQPMLEDGVTPDDSWSHVPVIAEIPAVPEVQEVSHYEEVVLTEGSDEQIEVWKSQVLPKYGDVGIEEIDITAEVEVVKAKAERKKALKKALKEIDWPTKTTVASLRAVLKDLVDCLDD